MEKLWNKFLAWLSGWPEGVSEENKIKEEFIGQSVKESQARKAKKKPTIKGLRSKKKKKQSK